MVVRSEFAHRAAHETEGFLGTTRELGEVKRGRCAMRGGMRQREAPVPRDEHQLAAIPAPTQPEHDINRSEPAANDDKGLVRGDSLERTRLPRIIDEQLARDRSQRVAADGPPRRPCLRKSDGQHDSAREHRPPRCEQQLEAERMALEMHDGVGNEARPRARRAERTLHGLEQVAPEERARSEIARTEAAGKLALEPFVERRRLLRECAHARGGNIQEMLAIARAVGDPGPGT